MYEGSGWFKCKCAKCVVRVNLRYKYSSGSAGSVRRMFPKRYQSNLLIVLDNRLQHFFSLHYPSYKMREQWCEQSPPPMCPGFDSQTRRRTFEFVGSALCSDRFSPRYFQFSRASKTYI